MALLRTFPYLLWLLLLAVGVIISSLHPVFINLGKQNGKIPFSSASVALLVEFFKLLISAGFVLKDICTYEKFTIPSPRIIMLYSVPAVLYTVNNNLITHIQLYMDPSSFQLLNNLKIAATAICYFFIINRHISRRKWFAVFLLFVSGVVNSIGGLRSDNDSQTKSTLYITITGLYLVIIYCGISGLAGVYTEAVLKRYKTTSIHLQNIILYAFGIILNAATFFFSSTPSSGFLDGFSIWTWSIVVTQALNGIIISLVLKHSSNITRLFMIGASMVLTSVFAYFIFGYSIHIYFFISFLIVIIALCFYHEFRVDVTRTLNL